MDIKQFEVSAGVSRLYSKRDEATFIVKGNSMDNGKSDAILNNDIVIGYALNMSVLKSKLRIDEFPFWVIYHSGSCDPVIKRILKHNVEQQSITVFDYQSGKSKLQVTEIQGLYYLSNLSRNLEKRNM